ncbi:MAG: choice-of-anchor Q domain-containing protein [Desulfuromonadales bacterium]
MKHGILNGINCGAAKWRLVIPVLLACFFIVPQAFAITLTVVDPDGNTLTTPNGYRWLLEEDTTTWTEPGKIQVSVDQPTGGNYATVPGPSIGLDIHSSYAPVVSKGVNNNPATPANITTDVNGAPLDATKRYFVSVLPNSDYSNSGAPVAPGQTSVTVVVQALPMPTAQISIKVFVDHDRINNVWDETDPGLGGASIKLADFSGGAVLYDAFGNPLGTTYDGAGNVVIMGSGAITTLSYKDWYEAQGLAPNGVTPITARPELNPFNVLPGEAIIKNLAPGKYGIIVVPPGRDDNGAEMTWVQTSTIEGTPTIDAWVQANEARIFTEGFGQGVQHAIFGFVKVTPQAASPWKGQVINGLVWLDPTHPEYIDRSGFTGSISGTLRLNHFSRPPLTQGFFVGRPVFEGWVGLNDTSAVPEVNASGVYAAAANPETGEFIIENVPPGTYQLVSWDAPLLNLFGTNTVTVPPGGSGTGASVNLGNVLTFYWFGDFSGKVFFDADSDGFPDAGEPGIPEQNVNIRFRDGTIYQAQPTDVNGEMDLAAVFPFFKWLVPEVDFVNYKATGMTAVTDFGGEVLPDNGWTWPSGDKLTPQPQCVGTTGQVPNDGVSTIEGSCDPLVTNQSGNNLSRTETGPVLTQAMHLFLNQFNEIYWGKNNYGPGENGGISGIVFYANTRAENDPAFAAAEPWEPGVPRVQVVLYQDNLNNVTSATAPDGMIDDINGTPGIQLADVDNYPFGWSVGGTMGSEDVERSGSDGVFDLGDALEVTATDSWDDNKPTGCVQTLPVVHGITAPECADAFATWNQIRPGLFDGGYAFGPAAGGPSLPTGNYIVEAVTPPGYELVKEEDKNVDFGETYVPGTLALPPACVGDPHTVPDYLSFQTYYDTGTSSFVALPGVTLDPELMAPFAGTSRSLCDRKQVFVNQGRNAAADFFLFTEVPKAARAVGFALNDLTAEFNFQSPNFGEKAGAPWIPVAFKDWNGQEITRVYTDEFGVYNAMVPGTFTANVPAPAGYSPNMLTLVLNDPTLPNTTADPFYNPTYTVTPWTFNYMSATSSYLDTPIIPLGAFSATGGTVDTNQVDAGPVIASVVGPEPAGGPLLCDTQPNGNLVEINSLGTNFSVPNPDYNPLLNPGAPLFITRDFSFGTVTGTVTLNGVGLVVTNWTADTITVEIPLSATTGSLMVTRGDNGISTQTGVTLNVVDCGGTAIREVPGTYPTIQAAIDAADPGDLILVAPGIYNENVVMNKPVHLQGAGAASTIINATLNPLSRLQLWHDRINSLGGAAYEAFLLKFPFGAGEAPAITVIGEHVFPTGNVQAEGTGTVTLNPGYPFDTPGQAVIDGFSLNGSVVGGGIFAVAGANYLTITNNDIFNNQGNVAGGIAIGMDDVGHEQENRNVIIRGNKIHKNAGVQGPGGIALNEDSDNYLVEYNLITGNFSSFVGAGIGHQGHIDGVGVIADNQILFNENHHNALLQNAGDGGGIFVGPDAGGLIGTGNVVINGNLIQGNITGSGRGGGIIAREVNYQDVLDNPTDPSQWYELKIVNNMIVNNVAAFGGGGIFLKDVAKSTIINNTIANNDSTSTSILAFAPGSLDSTPLPSGVVSGVHSAGLQLAFGGGFEQTFSNPELTNNIIWHNRSWYNDGTTTPGVGVLAPNPAGLYQDLGVINTAAPEFLSPMSSILTSTAGYDPSNLAVNPGFILEYTNTLSTATVLDEGGNAINVIYPELNASDGNYHITGGSPAVDAGAGNNLTANPQLAFDFDGETRPMGAGVDVGADEVLAGVIIVADKIGTFRNGQWRLDVDGNFASNAGDIYYPSFGITGDKAVAGDWNGDGITDIGSFRNGQWRLDVNNNGAMNAGDIYYPSFGIAGDLPVAGDWNGDGTADIGVYRNGQWRLDTNNDGNMAAGDIYYPSFGIAGDIPIAGDWDGDGTVDIGLFRNGQWRLDLDHNGVMNAGDIYYPGFGIAGDIPVVGVWNGDGTTDIGVFRNGQWRLDLDNNGTMNVGDIFIPGFGLPSDQPMGGVWR